jgi:hypothetical protein
MSVETEVKAAVAEVEKAVEGTVEKAEGEVKAVAQSIEGQVVSKEKTAVVQIKAEEKLFLRETELEYVKAQAEIQRLTKITEEKSKQYQTFVESLFKTYVVDKAEYIFDGGINAFKKL